MAPNGLKRKLLAFDTRTRKGSAKQAPRKKKAPTKSKPKAIKCRVKSEPRGEVIRFVKAEIPTGDTDDDTPVEKTELPASAELKPKVEYSPNAMAKCQGCRKKIQKEHKRFGIPEHSDRYNKEIYRYYHVRCCPTRFQNMVPDAVGQLAKQKQLVKNKEKIVEERQRLFKKLKKLRLVFANRLEVAYFMVYNNDVLKELVVNMPTTPKELLNIHGIGPAKVKSFGDPILTVIKQYKQQQQTTEGDRKPAARPKIKAEKQSQKARKRAAPSAVEVIAIDCDDDEEELVMGASLTCEQLVQQKFNHAAANGYVISVD